MKQRIDVYLTEKNFFESREKARAMIMAGEIFVNNRRVDKAGYIVKPGDEVEFRGKQPKFVSRGGLKLEKAIDVFEIDVKDKVCVDIGASTGGFTDCMLKNGAKKVYSIDVGYGQLAWNLRTDGRVVNLERTNIRYLDESLIKEDIEFISVDVSFISLRLVLPKIKNILTKESYAVCLIKPQFEAGKEQVGKNGVVRDEAVHKKVIEDIINFTEHEMNFEICGLNYSPIKGPQGNIEYLMYIKNVDAINNNFNIDDIQNIVRESHENL